MTTVTSARCTRVRSWSTSFPLSSSPFPAGLHVRGSSRGPSSRCPRPSRPRGSLASRVILDRPLTPRRCIPAGTYYSRHCTVYICVCWSRESACFFFPFFLVCVGILYKVQAHACRRVHRNIASVPSGDLYVSCFRGERSARERLEKSTPRARDLSPEGDHRERRSVDRSVRNYFNANYPWKSEEMKGKGRSCSRYTYVKRSRLSRRVLRVEVCARYSITRSRKGENEELAVLRSL